MRVHARWGVNRPVGLVAALVCTVALFVLPSRAEAQLGAEARMQMGFGGDVLANVQYSDGSDSDLRLGTMFSFSVGPRLRVWSSGPSSVEFLGLVGVGGWSTGPENTDDRLSFTRFPIELLGYYGYGFPGRDVLLRVGGGMLYQLAGSVSGSGSLDDTEFDVENALGGTAEVSAVFAGSIVAGLRYTAVKPVVEDQTMDGSSLGLFVAVTLPRF